VWKYRNRAVRLKERLELLNRDYESLAGLLTRMSSKNFDPIKSDKILVDFRDLASRTFQVHGAMSIVAWDRWTDLWRHLRHPGGLVSYEYTTKAATRLLDECVDATFSAPSSRFQVQPIIQFGPGEEYSFIESLSSVAIPTTDLMELHMWPAVSHEVFHAKIDQVTQNLQLLDISKSRRNARAALKTLVNDYNETELRAEIERCVDRPAKRLQHRTADCFSRLYKKFYHSKAYPPFHYHRLQMIEVLCDLASLRICGPADLLRSLVEWADYCSNVGLDFRNHALSTSHPLHTIRIMYMIKYLEKYLHYAKLNDPILKGYADQYAYFVDFCMNRAAPLLETNASEIFVAYREELLRPSTLDKLDTLVQQLMRKPLAFDPSKWKNLSDSYSAGQLPKRMSPIEITNLAWIVRADAYRECAYDFSLSRYNSALRRKHALLRRLFVILANGRPT